MRRAVVLAAVLCLVLSACGSDEQGGDTGKPQLVVSAAASMTEALTDCSPDFSSADVKLSFAGSDELAAQIRQGAKVDVFASANTKLPDALNSDGKLSDPVEFVTNALVLAVPADSEVASLDDVAEPGTKVAIGSESVPIGSYAREVLDRLPPEQSKAILDNVRSNEPDVKGIVGKLTQGAADAGFVYRSDVDATKGKTKAIDLADKLQPTVVYAAGVVTGSEQKAEAERYVGGLVSGGCADALKQASFGPPPG